MTCDSMSRFLRSHSPLSRPLLFGVLLLAVSCSEGTTTPAAQVPDVALWVANSGGNTVSVFDAATGAVTPIPMIPVGTRPQEVAVTPDGSRVLVTNYGSGTGTGSVSIIDGKSGRITTTIPTGDHPSDVAVTPDGKKAYVPNTSPLDFDVPQYNRVSVIDVASDSVAHRIRVGGGSTGGVAVTPDSRNVYVATGGETFVIDASTDSVTDSIPVGSRGIAVTPDGTKVYVVGGGSGGGTGVVSVIDVATDDVAQTIEVGGDPLDIAMTPDGTKAYVTNGVSGEVSVIDVATDEVVKKITAGPVHRGPWGVAITPDGTEAYVTDPGMGEMAVVDVASDSVTDRIEAGLGALPRGIAIR